MLDLAQIVMERIDALGQISEEPRQLTRTFCSDAMKRANDLVSSWMRQAGMSVRLDAIGNLIGRYPSRTEAAKTLLLGSHLDTVRNAGRFDGALGVLSAIGCVQQLHQAGLSLPFALEVVGFADEEGVRYRSTYLGSKALAGTFDSRVLEQTDCCGISMADALRHFGRDPAAIASARIKPGEVAGYAEVHIEQGPVLEQKDLAVGVVSAIAGQTRINVSLTGHAGHAGTTPMKSRRDALCAGAEWVIAVEAFAQTTPGLVATVGELTVLPGASNVIPGQANLSLDVRHPADASRHVACAELRKLAERIASKRRVSLEWQVMHETDSVNCDDRLTTLLGKAVQQHQPEVVRLASGAGHDAAAMAAATPVAMLFVRCKDGLSHHPNESVSIDDVRVALAVLGDFLRLLSDSKRL